MPNPTLRAVANTILFAGWMLPAILARLVPARLGPEVGDEVARMFNIVAGLWAFLALIYAGVLASRMRRDLE